MAQDVYVPSAAIGSTDWNGGRAAAGGSHTGQSTITMLYGATFFVAHSRAEVLRKIDLHAMPVPPVTTARQQPPCWVSFDLPNSGSERVVLNVFQIATVADGPPPPPPAPLGIGVGDQSQTTTVL